MIPRIIWTWCLALACCGLVFLAGCRDSGTQEPPTQPDGEKLKEPPKEHPKEHPEDKEHPAKGATGKAISKETLAKVIEDHVAGKAGAGGGFTFTDPTTQTTLTLTLDRVHKQRLSKVGDHLYFACADLKGSDGKMYDLDFFVQESDGKLAVITTETSLHKEAGKELYTWYEEGGIWKKRP